ncbi:hypothetical protein ASE03_13225 [Kitasatospora sp. Root187]|nr:hypothetical protein ASC99_10170 [Kitasatospora sp. Root107]KRB76629.1 hypothetical protein ASE03_13225 [Kitasatospora sp. Root187]
MLAHVWGIGLGVTSAYASDSPSVTDLVNQADAPELLGRLTGATVPVLEQQTASVGRALQDRIRTDGLPLPGQATTVPDAFAIAAVLLPAVPPQPRGDGDPRASRSSGGAEAPAAGTPLVATAALRPAVVGQTAAVTAAAPDRAAPVVRSADLQLVEGSWETVPPELTLATAAPVETEGKLTAVLVPIAAGLLLTGAAMYKHRGIPSGH